MTLPMPLKHATETLLVSLLGIAIVFASFAAAFLPDVHVSLFPWIVALIVSVLYPVLLYPLMKSRRADNAFRLLHLFPTLILLLRLGCDLLTPVLPMMERAQAAYRWGWSLPVAMLGFGLIVLFCLRVLRQRRLRITVLLILLLPFAALAIASEQSGWNARIAAVLKQPRRFATIQRWIAQLPGVVNRDSEEKWRMEQRRMERRAERLRQDDEAALVVGGALDGGNRPLVSSAAPVQPRKIVEKPIIARKKPPVPHLPPSGFGSEVALPLVLAGYTGMLHWRARRRMRG